MAKDGAEKGTQELESKGPLGYDRTLWVFWEATKEVALCSHIYVCLFLGIQCSTSFDGNKTEICQDTVGIYLRTINVKLIF